MLSTLLFIGEVQNWPKQQYSVALEYFADNSNYYLRIRNRNRKGDLQVCTDIGTYLVTFRDANKKEVKKRKRSHSDYPDPSETSWRILKPHDEIGLRLDTSNYYPDPAIKFIEVQVFQESMKDLIMFAKPMPAPILDIGRTIFPVDGLQPKKVRTSTGSTATPLMFCGTWGSSGDTTGRLYVRASAYLPTRIRLVTSDPL